MVMTEKICGKQAEEIKVTVEEVNRVLEVGRLLFSVLTPEEIEDLQRMLSKSNARDQIGNPGVT